LRKPIEFDGTNFESLFYLYDEIQEGWDEETADGIIQLYVKAFCDGDVALAELFNVANQKRKKEWNEESDRLERIKPKEDDGYTNN